MQIRENSLSGYESSVEESITSKFSVSNESPLIIRLSPRVHQELEERKLDEEMRPERAVMNHNGSVVSHELPSTRPISLKRVNRKSTALVKSIAA